jgi:hypothetical protein
MTLKLPDSVSSVHDLTALILEVREYSKWYLQYSNATKANTKYTIAQPEISPTAAEIIREWNTTSPLSGESLENLIGSLEAIKKSARTVTITLAAPATSEVKKALVSWYRKNVSETILITFGFNSNILGGMVVRYGSTIHDWSFRRVILNERSKFGEILRRV